MRFPPQGFLWDVWLRVYQHVTLAECHRSLAASVGSNISVSVRISYSLTIVNHRRAA